MPRRLYKVYSGTTAALTAAPVGLATGTALKTHLQLKPLGLCTVVRWGYSFESVPTALVRSELITTGTVNATMGTAFAAGDVVKLGDAGGTASDLVLATSGSGFNASAEGTVTSSRLLDYRNSWEQNFDIDRPLDREWTFDENNYLRVRFTTTVTITVLCWVEFEE